LRAKAGLTANELETLLAWFDDDRERAGERYEVMRLRLIEWFARRGSGSAEDLADEVLDRVAKRLAAGEIVQSGGFFLGVARHVFMESFSRAGAVAVPMMDAPEPANRCTPEQLIAEADEAAAHKHRVGCMVRCLRELSPEDFRLICEYYHVDVRGKRARIAARLGLSRAGLYTRMHRLGRRLSARLEDLLDRPARGTS
jgi:DNA-directed RNA polymerase specialized sigma24 family protein